MFLTILAGVMASFFFGGVAVTEPLGPRRRRLLIFTS
jgi:hypothetical protein